MLLRPLQLGGLLEQARSHCNVVQCCDHSYTWAHACDHSCSSNVGLQGLSQQGPLCGSLMAQGGLHSMTRQQQYSLSTSSSAM
jgi:hypothetical protein